MGFLRQEIKTARTPKEPCGVFVKIKTPEGAAESFALSSRLVWYVRQRIIFPNFIIK
jgi:hypothetical protein